MIVVLWLHFHSPFFCCFFQLFYTMAGQSVELYMLLKYLWDFLNCSSWLRLNFSCGDTLILSIKAENKSKALGQVWYEKYNRQVGWLNRKNLLGFLTIFTGAGFLHNAQAECQTLHNVKCRSKTYSLTCRA